jgi:hypothetical protein
MLRRRGLPAVPVGDRGSELTCIVTAADSRGVVGITIEDRTAIASGRAVADDCQLIETR